MTLGPDVPDRPPAGLNPTSIYLAPLQRIIAHDRIDPILVVGGAYITNTFSLPPLHARIFADQVNQSYRTLITVGGRARAVRMENYCQGLFEPPSPVGK